MSFNQVIYNNFSFPYVTSAVTETVLYAPDNATVEGTRYLFTISGFLTSDDESSFAAIVQTMRCQLAVPRQPFQMQWSPDGIAWVTLYAFDGTSGSDVAWGPEPGELQLTRFSGGKAAMYTWTLSATSKECYDGSCDLVSRPSEILSFTRRFDHTVDRNGFTTRTVTGRLKVSSGSVANGLPADNFRWFVINSLPLPYNYKRDPQNFQQSDDGTELTFSVTDVEQMWSLPLPISSGNASWTVRVRDRGAVMDYALSGRFEAPASVSKQSIMQQIGNLAVSRFSAAQAGAGALSFWYESRELVEEIYSNAVSFNITATSATGYGGQPDGSTGLFTGLQNFGLKPPGSTGQSQAIGPYGGDGTDYTSGVIAAAVAPFDTCKQTSGGGGPGGGGGNGVNQPPNLPPGTVGYLPNTAPPPGGTMGILNNNVSEDHLSAPYLAWHEVISYEIDNRIIALIPKQDGGVTVLQKTGTSQLTTIQCGYATRMGVPPVPAQPLKGPYDMIQSAYIAPAGREPIGNNPYDVFTLEWRYVIRSAINLESLGVANLNLCYGTDPRRSDDPTVTGPNVDFTGIELIEGAQGAQGS